MGHRERGSVGVPRGRHVRWIRRLALAIGFAGLFGPGSDAQDVGARRAAARPSTLPLPEGTPLQADQFPRFLQPTHDEEFGFDNVLVLGDHPTIRFEREDLDQAGGFVEETWARIGVADVAGRMVSVFRLAWPRRLLDTALATQRWGVDKPSLRWGDLVVSDAGADGRRALYLQLAPPNIPPAVVRRVSDTVQYSSHAVNIWVPGFGEGRIEAGDDGLELAEVTRRFYEVFVDAYETVAVVSQTALLSEYDGFHRLVQNAVDGIGLAPIDRTTDYGSDGVLQGVEAYPPGGWATGQSTLHQQAHQWGDYSGVWDRLGIDRQGREPSFHTPLLAPGSVLAGAVLEGTRRVLGGSPGVFTIDRTEPRVVYHPLTLYRMGLLELEELPELVLFVDQGQFDPDQRVAPSVGTPVRGETVTVRSQDFLAVDGRRRGPVADRVRRALVYVSRAGLATTEEMNVVNFYGARLAARDGVTSWDQYPGFFEATGERGELSTDITPRPGATSQGKIDDAPVVEYLDVAIDALAGVRLDQPIPGRIEVGQSVSIGGTVTADDRDDFSIVCFRFLRYGSADANEVFVCSSLVGARFAVGVEFGPTQRGAYTVEPFLFWPGSEGQRGRSRYGVIVVD